MCASIIAKLLTCGVVLTVVCDLEELTTGLHSQIKQIKQALLSVMPMDNPLISKRVLLSRIYSFDYGYLEHKNCPTKVNLENSGNSIALNSIQTLCLVRNVDLIWGGSTGK